MHSSLDWTNATNHAFNAVDGILDNFMFAATVLIGGVNPNPDTALPAWWLVDLGSLHVIDQMIISNRIESLTASGIIISNFKDQHL